MSMISRHGTNMNTFKSLKRFPQRFPVKDHAFKKLLIYHERSCHWKILNVIDILARILANVWITLNDVRDQTHHRFVLRGTMHSYKFLTSQQKISAIKNKIVKSDGRILWLCAVNNKTLAPFSPRPQT